MRIEELSIGDWVDIDCKPKQISSILETPMGGMVRCQNQSITAFVEHISPIPLTPEILEKNGLMRVSEEKGYEAYCCNDFLIRRSKFSCTDWWQVDVHYKQYVAHLSGYIQYVHQLQHLLTINECDKKIEL